MSSAARLEDQLDRRLPDVQLDALAHVLDIDQVGAARSDQREQMGERSGAVGQPHEQHEAPAGLALVAAGQLGQEPGVDVVTGEDDGRDAALGTGGAATEKRGDTDGAGALDDELGALPSERSSPRRCPPPGRSRAHRPSRLQD